MSKKAIALLRQVVKLYQEEDGASPQGSYRDAVTDILILAYKKFKKTYRWDTGDVALSICDEGRSQFWEEEELAENYRLSKIPDCLLPLHAPDEFEFDSTKHLFEIRLKKGKAK